MQYIPDNWVILRIKGSDPHYKVLAGWSGSYLNGTSWRLNSGIIRVEIADDYYNFYGSSGSCYKCHKNSYSLRLNNAYIWNQLSEKFGADIELMDETTDWVTVDWIIK